MLSICSELKKMKFALKENRSARLFQTNVILMWLTKCLNWIHKFRKSMSKRSLRHYMLKAFQAKARILLILNHCLIKLLDPRNTSMVSLEWYQRMTLTSQFSTSLQEIWSFSIPARYYKISPFRPDLKKTHWIGKSYSYDHRYRNNIID